MPDQPISLPEVDPATMFELLIEKSARIAELERQRDEVLALHERWQRPATKYDEARDECLHCRELCHSRSGIMCDQPYDGAWPCDTVKIYGGGQ